MSKNESFYEQLSEERKELQAKGFLPDWYTTGGWQMFKEKYMVDTDQAFFGQATRIAKTMARHMPESDVWEKKFFEIIWKGWLSPSTPVLANAGTKRGLVVSCSGNKVEDSIKGFYSARLETAMLTKNGFGTSSYLSGIRPRGTPISKGGSASGAVPVVKGFVQDMRDVAQGTARRGAWAGYLHIDHGDFYELAKLLETEPDDLNIGWIITDEFIARLNASDEDALQRFKRAMKVKCLTGKGYFWFVDKANRASPQMYKDLDLKVLASNLCVEIDLFSDEDHTYTCVLSSMNKAKYHEYKDTDAIFVATVFLDCVAQEFITLGRHEYGLEKAIRFTEKGRALGLGVCGFHNLLQQRSIPFDSFEAHMLNNQIFKEMHDKSLEASKWLATVHGEPEWCKGTGLRNTHRLAIAPTMSTAQLMGGVAQCIEPYIGNVFIQASAGGEMERVNPEFLKIMKERGKATPKVVDSIANNKGSVQHLDWLTEHEKKVFRTAFEVDQRSILRMASARQRFICQGQSLNLFFSADEDEGYIAEIHKEAFLDEGIKSLYYLRSEAGVSASKNECESCM